MGERLNQYLKKYIWILSILLLMVLFFQNCSVYQSQGRKEFESLLSSQGAPKGCLPYIDLNEVSNDINSPGGVYFDTSTASNPFTSEVVTYCSFRAISTEIATMDQVNCDVSINNASIAKLRSQLETNCSLSCQQDKINDFYPQEMQVQLEAYSPRPGTPYLLFQGTNSFGIIYLDQVQQKYGLKYFAVETNKKAGVSCAYILGVDPSVASSKLESLAKITETMAHNSPF